MKTTAKTQSALLTLLKQKSTAFILIILVGSICYSNTLHSPFFFDDRNFILETKGIRVDNLSSNELIELGQAIGEGKVAGRPVALISFAINYYFGGLNTFGYNLINLLIHLSSAVIVYLFLKFTLSLPNLQERYGQHAQEIALLSSLLFVIHPIQTQAVNYIFQRVTTMAALFFLLALYCYGKARQTKNSRQKAYFMGSILAAMLALGSKQNAITLPFFIALYEYYFWQRLDLGANKRKWLYALIGIGLAAILLGLIYTGFAPIHWLNQKYQTRSFTPGQRTLTQLRIVIFYISLLIVPLPSRLNLDHHFPLSYSLLTPPTTLVCFFLILGIIAGSVYLAKRRPLISFGLIWFWGNLVLESSFLPLELIFEHRLYLPSVGFFLLVSILLVKGVEKLKTQIQIKQGIKAGLLIALIVPLTVMTYQRNKVWQDKIVLWKDALSKSPQSARSNYNLAYIYAEKNQFAEAIAQYQRTVKIHPEHKNAHYNLGKAYHNQGELTKAIAQYQHLLTIDPGYEYAHTNLGNIYLKQGRLKQAIAEFFKEIKHHPDNAYAYYNLAVAYQKQGLKQKARQAHKQAMQINPSIAAPPK